MGGDLGGAAPEEMPAGDAGADADAGGGDDSALLAVPPGSRNSPRLAPRVYKGPHGKSTYRPVRRDKRGAGARSRSYASHYSKEKSSSGVRNLVPGASDINSLAKMGSLANGIYENEASIYKLEEQLEEEKLFTLNNSVREILQTLEKKTQEKSEHENEN